MNPSSSSSSPSSSLLHLCKNPDKRGEDWFPDVGQPPLNQQQLKEAADTLISTTFVVSQENGLFPRLERQFEDTPIPDQKISLFSFFPSPNAVPDENGIFGFCKIRGSFPSKHDASKQAHKILQEDSVHVVHHVVTGSPFPIVEENKSRFFNLRNCDLINANESLEASWARANHHKQMKEYQAEKNLKKRRQALENSTNREMEDDDPYDCYLCQISKLDALKSNYHVAIQQMNENKDLFEKTILEVDALKQRTRAKTGESEHEFLDKCRKKYIETYEKIGSSEESLGPERFKQLMDKVFGDDVFNIEKSYQKTMVHLNSTQL